MDTLERPLAQRSMYLLNERGHITIAWTEAEDEQIKELIAKKMQEGYSFFCIVPAHFDQPQRQAKVTKVSDIGELRNIVINDADAERLFKEGIVGVISDQKAEINTSHKARTAEEAASTSTVAVRPKRGG